MGWNAANAAGSAGYGAITLVEGSSFCISLPNGDMLPHYPHGVFYQDTRILSLWRLTMNGQPIEALGAWTPTAYQGIYLGRAMGSDEHADSSLTVERRRDIGAGIAEHLTVHNYSNQPTDCRIALTVGVDFADLFEVKDGRPHRQWKQQRVREQGHLRIEAAWKNIHRAVKVYAPGGEVTDKGIVFRVAVPASGSWSTRVAVVPAEQGREAVPGPDVDAISPQEHRRQSWMSTLSVLSIGNSSVEKTIRRSRKDIGALRIVDPQRPERMVVAAGAPWFMALFGRDSLLTSFMVLPLDASLALGTLQTLAEKQGSIVDALTEEQPGKILHEVRFGLNMGIALGGKAAYYGTVDATPLFVTLLGETFRWGLPAPELAQLLPNADKALEWVRLYGDRDGDGFVEYERSNDQGLINQGWKDSWDGINFADGTLAEPPIALCEVQGYVYSAYMSRAWLALKAGDAGKARELRDRALLLKKQFNEKFWLEDRGYFAVALDRDKRPVDACASNMGHCLWSGIVDEDKAQRVVDRLMSPEMFSGWGVRTLASDMGAYNPISYHNGSVWPHDNALIAAGLMRYGFVREAQRIASALMEAAEYTENTLPELFCGFDRSEYPTPVAYPTACSPQAWSSAAPVMLLRTLLQYEADVPAHGLWMDPILPENWGELHSTNASLNGARLTIDVSADDAEVTGLPEGMVFYRSRRPTFDDLLLTLDGDI